MQRTKDPTSDNYQLEKDLINKRKAKEAEFFESDDYKNLVFICERLHVKHTLRNYVQFMKYRDRCINISITLHLDVGYNRATGRYDWLQKITMNFTRPEYSNEEFDKAFRKYGGDDLEPCYDTILAHV